MLYNKPALSLVIPKYSSFTTTRHSQPPVILER